MRHTPLVDGVRVQQHLHFALQAPDAARRGVAAQPGVDVAADDTVQRSGGQAGQAFVRHVPAQRGAPTQQVAVAGEKRQHGLEPVSYTHLDVYKRQEGAKALAMLRGRRYVLPEDMVDLVPDVLRHRLVLSYDCLLYTSRCV